MFIAGFCRFERAEYFHRISPKGIVNTPRFVLRQVASCSFMALRYKKNMQTPQISPQLRKKNLFMLGVLLLIIVLFYALSFVKFGQAVTQNPPTNITESSRH